MILQIENYFGNDILTLIFNEKDTQISKEVIKEVEDISNKFGYNVADLDIDENNAPYIRVQECDVDNSEKTAKTELLNLISELSKAFL